MKKIFLTICLGITPLIFFVLTTPIASLSEHLGHMLFFGLFGIAAAGFYSKQELRGISSIGNRRPFFAFSGLVFIILGLFITTHLLPCPYMFSSHSANAAINHPCSQPSMPFSGVLIFVLGFFHIFSQQVLSPLGYVAVSLQASDNRSPPLV